MKNYFKNMPIEISYNEYMILANTLYASFNAMTSENDMILIIDSNTKKVYGFDSINELDKIKEYGQKSKHHLLQITNGNRFNTEQQKNEKSNNNNRNTNCNSISFC